VDAVLLKTFIAKTCITLKSQMLL